MPNDKPAILIAARKREMGQHLEKLLTAANNDYGTPASAANWDDVIRFGLVLDRLRAAVAILETGQ